MKYLIGLFGFVTRFNLFFSLPLIEISKEIFQSIVLWVSLVQLVLILLIAKKYFANWKKMVALQEKYLHEINEDHLSIKMLEEENLDLKEENFTLKYLLISKEEVDQKGST